ncbi:bifunctional diguanylate cyclase/phosphodiesterase [Metabacillus sp. B2-18]|uniref:bifunctional diguanylate cyclase/phosphodiesterase n=1 Tax=Metabacillus sp. B2-18 TaxID=2897333 RepID=UPI001E2CF822|nr:bifunctional diguanylate cyclase/phosphodiesterase [Metabacillus sp. B2-18]UGB32427.1 EAL domain-containing protein [Metabacillus sp. B2-18]
MTDFLNLKKDFNNDKKLSVIESFIFQIILKHINDLIFIMKVEIDGSFTYLFVNEMGKIRAKLDNNYAGKTFYDLQPAKSADELNEKYTFVKNHKMATTFQDRVKIDENHFAYGETILTPIQNDDGDVIYIIGVTRDISERVHEKTLLIESQQMYKSLVDFNMDAVLSVDNDGVICSFNHSAKRILKVDDEYINVSVFSLFEYSYHLEIQHAFQRSINGESSEGEAVLIQKQNRLNVHYKTVPIMINETVSGIFFILRDITEKVKHAELIEHLAYHDSLTGLYNRSALKKDLPKVMEISKQNQTPLALMFMDLDRFKMLNDTLGHNNGDQILIEVGKRLLSINSPEFNVYRHGGDEFIIVLPSSNVEAASKVASQILDMFKDPFSINDNLYYVSISIGISIYPDDCQDEDSLIMNADKALYVVKQSSRAQYQHYHKAMDKNTNELLSMETALRRSIGNNELKLHYQPQVDLHTNEIVSYEVLLRWENSHLGNVSPAKFVPIAEESGLIISIGEWVIEEACKQLMQWKKEGLGEIVLAINLSAKQFEQPYLVEKIKSLFSEYYINPNQIEFEITEGALQNVDEALHIMSRLKEIGVAISIDDFGTGYSSLMYLKQFPIDSLKIDQSFIREVLTDQKDEAIVKTILSIAENLGLLVVAEGIETLEQLNFLKTLNCQKGQGFYFSKPIPPEEITNRLKD